jgi:hypothetical protein
MRCIHTLNVLYVLAHNVHHASHRSKTKLNDNSGHYSRRAICLNKQMPAQWQADEINSITD